MRKKGIRTLFVGLAVLLLLSVAILIGSIVAYYYFSNENVLLRTVGVLAGFGVANRIESMTLVVFYALSAIIGPFVGQNFSAGNESRVLQALRLCMWFCVISGLLMAAGLAALADYLPTLFSDSTQVVTVASLFLWVAPIGYGAYGMVMVMNASFNGLGQPMPAVGISVGRILLLYLPLAIAGKYLFGALGIFAAYSAANIISGLVAYRWAKSTVRRQFSELS